MTAIGDYLKKLRGSKSLREIERLSGVSNTYLSSLEKGADPRTGSEIIPSPEILKKLASALDADYFELMAKAGYWSEDAGKYRSEVTSQTKGELEVLRNDLKQLQQEIDNDLFTLLSNPAARYKGYLLSQEDRQRILDMLEILLPNR